MSKMGNLVGYLMERLLANEMIEESQQEIYQYGLERLINKTVGFTLLLLLAIGIQMLLPSVLFLCFLFLLRGRTGGYHAASEYRCLAGTAAIYLLCMKVLLPLLQQSPMMTVLCFLVSAAVIFLLAPVNHPNIGFSREEMKFYKKRSRMVLGGEITAIFIFVLVGVKEELIVSAMMGIMVCAFLLCLAKITKQEVITNEGW